MPNRLVADKMLDISSVMIVTRSFNGAGRDRYRGEVVDTTGWYNVASLSANRYLAPLPNLATELADIEINGETRRFIDEARAAEALSRSEATRTPQGAFDRATGMTTTDDLADTPDDPSAGLKANPETVQPARESPKGSKGSHQR